MQKFDQDYYQRYYGNAETRAVSAEKQTRQIHFVASYLRYLDIRISSGIDVGCGVGQMLAACEREFPNATWQGIEFSAYLCDKHGWIQGSVVDTEIEPADFIICSDVLGYLGKRDCKKAIKNLARMTNQALYLSVLTSDDLDICDQDITDMSQKLRPASWYKEHLNKLFVSIGGGVFLKKPLTAAVWKMEQI